MFTNKNYQLVSVLLMFSTNVFGGVLILPPSKAPPVERVKKKPQPAPAVEIPKVQTQSGCVSKPDSSAAIPVSQADYLNQGKDSSIQILIDATAKYNAGQMTNEDYIKVAQGVSLRADGYNKIIQTFNTGIGTAGAAGTAGIVSVAGATPPIVAAPTVAAPKPGPCTISYKCTDAIERQARESQANSINAGASFVWQGLIGKTCRYSVLNHCAYWNKGDGTHPYSCKDFANQTVFAEETCTPNGSGAVAVTPAATTNTAAPSNTPAPAPASSPASARSCPGGSDSIAATIAGRSACSCTWGATPAGSSTSGVCTGGGNISGTCSSLGEWKNVVASCPGVPAAAVAPSPAAAPAFCDGGSSDIPSATRPGVVCSCSWPRTQVNSHHSKSCTNGGSLSGTCSSTGWVDVRPFCY